MFSINEVVPGSRVYVATEDGAILHNGLAGSSIVLIDVPESVMGSTLLIRVRYSRDGIYYVPFSASFRIENPNAVFVVKQKEDFVIDDGVMKMKVGTEVNMAILSNRKYMLFFGVDNHMFKLDHHVLEAVEDPDDGYRSMLENIVVKDARKTRAIFPVRPLDRIRVVKSNAPARDGWALMSTRDNYIWLEIGTDYADDYYPYFIFEYRPRPPGSYKFERVKKVRPPRVRIIR